MKNGLSKTATTLIELIVTSLLVVIVILGMFSINSVLNNNSQDYGQRYLVKSETQATLNHILNNASLAVGSANCNDEGILIGNGSVSAACGGGSNGLTDSKTFCIHQAGTSTQGGQNLIGSASDIWLCYSWTNTVAKPYQISWCAENYPTGSVADPRGATSCSSALSANLIPNPTTGANITFLGTAYSVTNTGGSTLSASPQFLDNGTQLLFSINIQNCLNNSLSTCQLSGTSTDPVNNPEVSISGSVIPSQESM